MKVPSIPSDHLGYKEDLNNVMKKVSKGEDVQPHPGSYEIRTSLLSKSQGFKWNHQHRQPRNQFETPGPCNYDSKVKSHTMIAVSSFKSTSQRFINGGSKKEEKPGPGAYTPLKQKMKSHSFNQ